MGWITLAQARAGAGTVESTNAAAKSIATWLEGQNAGYEVSCEHPTETVYSHDGISFVQEEDIVVKEYRGLAEDLGEFLARHLAENNTRKWKMYGITTTGEIHEVEATYGPPASSYVNSLVYWLGGAGSSKSVTDLRAKLGNTTYFYPPTEGLLVVANSQRSNAADGWMLRVTYTRYILPEYGYASNLRKVNKAFIPFPPTEAWDGVVVSEGREKTFVTYDGNTPVYQNVSTVVREYRYLTKAMATSKVASESASNSKTFDVRVTVSWGTGGSTYKNVTVRGGGNAGTTAATDKVPTSRPQGDGLYTVSVNEVTYQVTNS